MPKDDPPRPELRPPGMPGPRPGYSPPTPQPAKESPPPLRKDFEKVSQEERFQQNDTLSPMNEDVAKWGAGKHDKLNKEHEEQAQEIQSQFDQRRETLNQQYAEQKEQLENDFQPTREEIEKRQALEDREGRLYAQSEQAKQDQDLMAEHSRRIDGLDKERDGKFERLEDVQKEQENNLEEQQEIERQELGQEIHEAEMEGRVPEEPQQDQTIEQSGHER